MERSFSLRRVLFLTQQWSSVSSPINLDTSCYRSEKRGWTWLNPIRIFDDIRSWSNYESFPWLVGSIMISSWGFHHRFHHRDPGLLGQFQLFGIPMVKPWWNPAAIRSESPSRAQRFTTLEVPGALCTFTQRGSRKNTQHSRQYIPQMDVLQTGHIIVVFVYLFLIIIFTTW